MRFVTWNVRSLRDARSDVVDVLRSVEPDVVCLQEVPRLVLARRRAASLASDCGLVVATAGQPVGGLAVLVRPQIRVVAALRVPLPWQPGLHRRGLALAVLETPAGRVVAGSLHLGLSADERMRHIDLVLRRLRGLVPPVVVGADLNEPADQPAFRQAAGRLTDAWAAAGTGDGRTFSTRRPRRRIDAVLVDPRLDVRSCQVVTDERVSRASDHRPVVVDVGLPTDPV